MHDFVDVLVPFDFPGPTIPPNFASFSLEPYTLADWADKQPKPVSPTFLNLMRQLHPTPDSPGPTLRIGGNSGDMSSYNPHHSKRPVMPYGRQLWFDWTDSDVARMGEVAEALNGKLVLGVNFRTPGNASVAIGQLQAVERLIGWSRIAAIEIGNEPDVYEWTQLRPANYSLSTYTTEWLYYAQSLHAALPDMPGPIFQGGAFGTLNWAASWRSYLSRARNYLKSVSFHYYPLSLCQGGTPTINRLLSDYASQGAARQLLRTNALTNIRQYGLPLVVSEGSSVSCGRIPGVSNSYASALWAIDEMLIDASIGIQSWHFHYAGGNSTLTYSPLVRQQRDSQKLTVMPIYYGLRFFALATANYSTVYRVNHTSSDNPHVKVYSLISRQGNIQLVIIHKDATALHDAVVTLRVAVPVAFRQLPSARVLRLSAPSATSVDGVRLGGYTYDGSENGEVRGEGVEEWMEPVDGGYSVTVGRLSAVLLQLNQAGPYHVQTTSDSQAVGSAVGVDEQLPSLLSADHDREESGSDEQTAALSLDTTDDTSHITANNLNTNQPTSTHEDNSVAAIEDSISTESTPQPPPAAHASDRAELPAGFVHAGENWKVRRGRWALVNAQTTYEQQVGDSVERIITDRRRGGQRVL